MPRIPQTSSTAVSSHFTNMTPLQINIDTTTSIVTIIVFIFGLGAAWGTLKHAVSNIAKSLEKIEKKLLEKIEPEIAAIGKQVAVLWADKYAPADSPRKLNERGMEILNGSGIKEMVHNQKQELLELVRAKQLTNPYDAELEIQKIMMDLPNRHPDLLDRLKIGAYNSGVDLNTVLFTGSIYLRDSIFKELGFNLDDLDNPSNPPA